MMYATMERASLEQWLYAHIVDPYLDHLLGIV
jgi:hypothetical protein